jgi:hypothetical protein
MMVGEPLFERSVDKQSDEHTAWDSAACCGFRWVRLAGAG